MTKLEILAQNATNIAENNINQGLVARCDAFYGDTSVEVALSLSAVLDGWMLNERSHVLPPSSVLAAMTLQLGEANSRSPTKSCMGSSSKNSIQLKHLNCLSLLRLVIK